MRCKWKCDSQASFLGACRFGSYFLDNLITFNEAQGLVGVDGEEWSDEVPVIDYSLNVLLEADTEWEDDWDLTDVSPRAPVTYVQAFLTSI